MPESTLSTRPMCTPMRPMASSRQVSVAQIIGAKSMDQLRDKVASTRVRLDDAEMKQLDEISLAARISRMDDRLSRPGPPQGAREGVVSPITDIGASQST